MVSPDGGGRVISVPEIWTEPRVFCINNKIEEYTGSIILQMIYDYTRFQDNRYCGVA
jgi:hypothetical protein